MSSVFFPKEKSPAEAGLFRFKSGDEGSHHLAGFGTGSGIAGQEAAVHTVDDAAGFAKKMKDACIDASAQIYKANCLPAMLMKPPVIASEATIDYILDTIDSLLA